MGLWDSTVDSIPETDPWGREWLETPDIVPDDPFPQDGPGLDYADLSPPEEWGVSGNVGANVEADVENVQDLAGDAGDVVVTAVEDATDDAVPEWAPYAVAGIGLLVVLSVLAPYAEIGSEVATRA